MKRKITLYVDLLIFIGWTVIGALNLIFFIVHVSPVNLAGIFTGKASLSFTFMTASAFIMTPVSVIILYIFFRRKNLLERLRSNPVWRMARMALAAFALFLIILEANIIIASFPEPVPAGADVLILGAYVSKDGPSEILFSRLTAGLEYAAANPGARVIVSGGQGLDEPVSEAEAMRDFLVAHGLEESRILLEDKSHNTYQNLVNSIAMLTNGEEPYAIAVVTSEFHIFRTAMLAARAGVEPYFMPAKTPPGILLSCYSRELFGVIKSYFMDK
jgi:uncharacterized SAM-binding protein YcdF (DUF218 family)